MPIAYFACPFWVPSLSDTNGDGIPDGDGDTDGDTFIDRLDPLPFDFNFMDGDINADAIVDMADALIAMRIATNQITPDTLELQHGDVVPTPIPDGIIDIADTLIIMRKAMGLIALNMNAIEQGLTEYASKHNDQQELVAELKTKIHEHRQEILLILANLNDKIITKTGDAPARPITQSMSTTSRKGILVATIGDLTGLLSGTYENIYYFINDHLGTPQMLTDSNAIVVWQADYDPFGKATVNDDPDGNGTHVTNNIRFPGQYFDSETGLHYNYHRYYDPGIGRYLQPDPVLQIQAGVDIPEMNRIPYLLPYMLGSPLELHNYVYVQNNPSRYGDPNGLYCGPGKYEKYINDRPGGCDFSKCCKFHDDCYDPNQQSCGGQRQPKSKCDTDFLKCMLITNLKYDCIKWALLYYSAVKVGGWASY